MGAHGTARIRAMTTFYHARHARKPRTRIAKRRRHSLLVSTLQWPTISRTNTQSPSSGRCPVRHTKPQQHYVARAGIFEITSCIYSARVGQRPATRSHLDKRVGYSQRRANLISTSMLAGCQGAANISDRCWSRQCRIAAQQCDTKWRRRVGCRSNKPAPSQKRALEPLRGMRAGGVKRVKGARAMAVRRKGGTRRTRE